VLEGENLPGALPLPSCAAGRLAGFPNSIDHTETRKLGRGEHLKVLVTGAEGFIGSHVVEELVGRGHQVTALCLYNSFDNQGWLGSLPVDVSSQVDVVLGDVRDSGFVREIVRGHDSVAHLAALIAIPYSYHAPASYVETNVVGTLNVLEAAKAASLGRVVHTSTSEVYGTAQYVPIDERHPLVGQSPYSASKIAADQLAHSYWASFSLPVTTVRPFNTYGPRQSQRAFIPAVFAQLLAEPTEIHLGSLEPTRDLTFVGDTARGFADVIESDKGAGQTFNMGSGFEVSMRDVVDTMFEITGQNPNIVLDRNRVRPEASEVQRLWSDSSNMTQTFGWQPRYSGVEGLRRGLSETYEWLATNQEAAGYDQKRYVI